MTSSAPSLPVRGFGTHTDRLATGLTQPDLRLTPGVRTRRQDRGQRSTGKGRESDMGDFFCPSSFSASCIVSWLARACGRRRGHGQDGSGPAADFLPPPLAALCGPLWHMEVWERGVGGAGRRWVCGHSRRSVYVAKTMWLFPSDWSVLNVWLMTSNCITSTLWS